MGKVTKQINDDKSISYRFKAIGEDPDMITISVASDGCGVIEGNIKAHIPFDANLGDSDVGFNNALDGMESILLALACEGFDLSGEKVHSAIQTALGNIGNNF